ncbi:MAG: hypothetical protein ACHQNT_13100 [Bacteroidia bacterium]
MRLLIQLFLIEILISCSHPLEKSKIIGLWTMEDPSKGKLPIVDTIAFLSNGTSTTRVYMKETLQQSFTVKYDIDEENHLLIVSSDSSQDSIKIVELNSKHLILKPLKLQGFAKYIRL